VKSIKKLRGGKLIVRFAEGRQGDICSLHYPSAPLS
jgi:hypothetical protein